MSWSDYSVFLRQEPVAARACGSADRPDRRPVDPTVILQLRLPHSTEMFTDGPTMTFFCMATLLKDAAGEASGDQPAGPGSPAPMPNSLLTGTTLSSIFYMKEPGTGKQGGAYFVFPDLNVRSEGAYRLRFDVFRMQEQAVHPVAHCISQTFTVYSAKRFPGMTNSTELSKLCSEQGLKIRIRKDLRVRKHSQVEPLKKKRLPLPTDPSTSLELDIEQDASQHFRTGIRLPRSRMSARSPEFTGNRRLRSRSPRDHHSPRPSGQHRTDEEEDSLFGRGSAPDNRLYSQRHVSLLDSNVRDPDSSTIDSRGPPQYPWPQRGPVSSPRARDRSGRPTQRDQGGSDAAALGHAPEMVRRSSSSYIDMSANRGHLLRRQSDVGTEGGSQPVTLHQHYHQHHHHSANLFRPSANRSDQAWFPAAQFTGLPSFSEAFPGYASFSSSSSSARIPQPTELPPSHTTQTSHTREEDDQDEYLEESRDPEGRQQPSRFMFPPPPLPRGGL